MQGMVVTRGWQHGPLQIYERDEAEQGNRNEIIWRFHTMRMTANALLYKSATALVLGALASLTAACGSPEPTGQVLASVDGDAVTLAEINREFDLRGMSDGAEGRELANNAVEQVIDRKLLAEAARERDLDRDAKFHFAMRRAEEELLVDMLRDRIADELPAPTPAEIDRFIAENPHFFGERRIVTLENKQTGRAMSLDSVRFKTTPPDWFTRAEPGKTLRFQNTKWRIGAVQPMVQSTEKHTALAKEMVNDQKTQADLARILVSARDSEAIHYQRGWGPSAR